MNLYCKNCNQPLSSKQKKYCSRKCNNIVLNKSKYITNLILKKCYGCGNEFHVRVISKENNRKYCGKCATNHKIKFGKIIKCLMCRKEFYASPSSLKKQRRFCSKGCKGKYFSIIAESLRPKINCKNCGKLFSIKQFQLFIKPRKYCSMKCRVGYPKPKARRTIIKNCLICGKSFRTVPSVDKMFCSQKCNKMSMRQRYKNEKNPNWKGGIAYINQGWRRSSEHKTWQLAVFKRDHYMCSICSSRKNICAHHIAPASKYSYLKYEINNGITLCALCHYNLHAHRKREKQQKFIICQNYKNDLHYELAEA